MEEQNNTELFNVVVNHEMQYSIWPEHTATPAGWNAVGVRGHKDVCLAHIESVWTDMRPLSLQKHMRADAE